MRFLYPVFLINEVEVTSYAGTSEATLSKGQVYTNSSSVSSGMQIAT